jgi:hypothetical protein
MYFEWFSNFTQKMILYNVGFFFSLFNLLNNNILKITSLMINENFDKFLSFKFGGKFKWNTSLKISPKIYNIIILYDVRDVNNF